MRSGRSRRTVWLRTYPSLMAEVLREACEHGRYERHAVNINVSLQRWSCPGGREVTIDYEAAGSMLAELRRVHVVMVDADHSARRIIGAALAEADPSSVAALSRLVDREDIDYEANAALPEGGG